MSNRGIGADTLRSVAVQTPCGLEEFTPPWGLVAGRTHSRCERDIHRLAHFHQTRFCCIDLHSVGVT